MDESGTAAIERDIAAAQTTRSARANEIVTASSLTRTRYRLARVSRQRPSETGTEGWVDLVFTVRADGTVGDVTVAGAEPAGIFEQAAMSAVRKWRYEPVLREGRAGGSTRARAHPVRDGEVMAQRAHS